MAKGITVFDIPETCGECNYKDSYLTECRIQREIKEIYKYVLTKEKPEQCPIKPMPKKKVSKKTITSNYDGRVYTYDPYVSGWNACIDEILGGSE